MAKNHRKCKICKDTFEKKQPLQFVCSPKCGYEYAKKQKEKAWKKEKKEIKESLKTKNDYEKELEVYFNKFIRERDKNEPCISCGAKAGSFKLTAGHYYPAGSYKNLRFDEENVHGQCWFNCNKNRHGNLIEYRRGLMRKIGEVALKSLEERRLIKRGYTIPELILMKEEYKEKIRQHEKTT